MARGKFGKAALLLGAAAVAAGVLLKRDKVAGLLPSRSQSGTQDTGWAPSPAPAPSNYDAPGPVANTATPVPAPDAQVLDEDGHIDEQAEEAAAAAEAANIGGQVSDYAGIGEPSISADEAERPLVEAGEGSSEGQEQAEAALADAAGPSDGVSDYERQIDDAIEEAGQPFAGETLEAPGPLDEAPTEVYDTPASEPAGGVPFGEGTTTPGVPQTEEPAPPEPEAQVTPAAPQTGAWQPPAPPEPAPEAESPQAPAAPQEPQAGEPPADPESSDPTPPTDQPQLPTEEDKDDGNDWRTWSGRAINP